MKQLKKEDLMNAHKNGCSDVKKVLENLYPDEFNKGVKITFEGRDVCLNGNSEGFIQNNNSIYICSRFKVGIEPDGEGTKIIITKK